LTLVFDREAWSPKAFQQWQRQGVDVITYRKGKQTPWDPQDFRPVTVMQEGKPVVYWLAERSVQVLPATRQAPAWWMREIRRLCPNGHRTAIPTTRQDLPAEVIATGLFARWRQENFFKYMQGEFDIDHLSTYATEPADGARMVPNPARRALAKTRQAIKRQLGTALARRAQQQRDGATVAKQAKTLEAVERLTAECEQLSVQIAATDQRVPLHSLHAPEALVHHERERKTITQLIKVVAYRSERTLARLIEPFFARHDEEVYAFLKAAFCLPGDLIPDEAGKELRVRLYGMANHRSQRALSALCEQLNAQAVTYPGTDLRLVYEAIQSH
jgi:hypothetical protein